MNQDSTFWLHPQSGNLITPRVKLSYANLLVPRPMKDDPQKRPIHGATLLIPTIANMDAAIQAWHEACQRGLAGDGCDAWPPTKLNPATGQQEQFYGMAMPFKYVAQDTSHLDAQGQVLPEFQPFTYFIRVRTYDGQPPGIMLPSGVITSDPNEVYSGRWAVCSIQPFPYNNAGNYGVSFSIQNCQLLEHDDRIGGGRADVKTEFQTRSDVNVGMMPGQQAPAQPQMPGFPGVGGTAPLVGQTAPGAAPAVAQPGAGMVPSAPAVAPQGFPQAVQQPSPVPAQPGAVPQIASPQGNAYAQGMAPPAQMPQPQPGAPVAPGTPVPGTPMQPAPQTTMQQPQIPGQAPNFQQELNDEIPF